MFTHTPRNRTDYISKDVAVCIKEQTLQFISTSHDHLHSKIKLLLQSTDNNKIVS